MPDAGSQNNQRPKPHNALRISIISAVILFLPPPAQAAAWESACSLKGLTKLATEAIGARDLNEVEAEIFGDKKYTHQRIKAYQLPVDSFFL